MLGKFIRILRSTVEFFGIVCSKLLFDYWLFYNFNYTYTSVIFWETVIAFIVLYIRYKKMYKIKDEEFKASSKINFPFFKTIHFKVYNSLFIKFIKNNKLLLTLLFSSNGDLYFIFKNIMTGFLPSFSNNSQVVKEGLSFLILIESVLKEQNIVINLFFSFYFCLIIYLFWNQIEFELMNTDDE